MGSKAYYPWNPMEKGEENSYVVVGHVAMEQRSY
jgi:hypothetical protein